MSCGSSVYPCHQCQSSYLDVDDVLYSEQIRSSIYIMSYFQNHLDLMLMPFFTHYCSVKTIMIVTYIMLSYTDDFCTVFFLITEQIYEDMVFLPPVAF
jgi:hypothetical protein